MNCMFGLKTILNDLTFYFHRFNFLFDLIYGLFYIALINTLIDKEIDMHTYILIWTNVFRKNDKKKS